MVKEVDALGLNYPDFIKNEGIPIEGFLSVPFYFDGDSTKGEFDLPKLVDTLGVLTQHPNYDSVSWQINETSDLGGREAIVLHVPTVFAASELGVKPPKKPEENVGEKPNPTKKARPEDDLYEGKRFYVNATSKTGGGRNGFAVDFLAIIQFEDDEQIQEEARRMASTMTSAAPEGIDATPIPMDKISFRKMAIRMLDRGKRLPDIILSSDQEIQRHLNRRRDNRSASAGKHYR